MSDLVAVSIVGLSVLLQGSYGTNQVMLASVSGVFFSLLVCVCLFLWQYSLVCIRLGQKSKLQCIGFLKHSLISVALFSHSFSAIL